MDHRPPPTPHSFLDRIQGICEVKWESYYTLIFTNLKLKFGIPSS